jgi:cell division protein FtsB
MTRRNRSQSVIHRQRGAIRRIAIVLGAIAGVLLLTSFVFDEMGLIKYWGVRSHAQQLERELAELERTNAALRAEISRVQQNPARIEELARERLGYVRRNETVYQIVEDTKGEGR